MAPDRQAETTEPAPNVLRNRIKARLLLAGVDAATIERAEQGEPGDVNEDLLELMRTRVLWGSEDLITITEVAERAGIEVEVCRRARMLMGLPDPGDQPLCRVEEVQAFQSFAAGISLFGIDPVLQFTRVIGSALATVAEGSLTVFGRALADQDAVGPRTGDEYVLAAFDAMELFVVLPDVLEIVAKLQFDVANQRLTGDPGQAQTTAVGFVDITGSTRVTDLVGDERMAAALTRFEERSVELAVAAGGRVVKYIGDEVMFLAPDLAAATPVAVELVRHAKEDPVLPSARAGVAYGPVLSRDGDWYGTTVNLASRLVEKAKASTVVLAGEGAAEVPGAVGRGRRRLRGLADRVEVWRVEL